MPDERRQTLLSEDEVMLAIQSYARMKPGFLPMGQVLGFRIGLQPGSQAVELTISVEARYGATRSQIDVRADDDDLLELLIRCCLENNIPIPRASVKNAAIIDGLLALTINYDNVMHPVS